MAAPSIVQVMAGIETQLKTITGLRTDQGIPEQISTPMAIVGVPDIPSYHESFAHGHLLIHPTVTILVSKAYSRTAQIALASYANPTGATSIHTAIEADKTLGGIVDDVIVESFHPLNVEEVGLIGYVGGVFQLKVICKGV